MKNPNPSPMFRPKVPCVPTMCRTCPFQPGGEGLGLDHPDFQPGGAIVESILLGMPFYCHSTATLNPRTKWRDGAPEMVDGRPQPHWRHCLGAALFKQGSIELPERIVTKGEGALSEATYSIAEDGKSITCRKCGRTSHNPTDVGMRFCSACDWMHELGRPRRLDDVLRLNLVRGERPAVALVEGGYELADATGVTVLHMVDGSKCVGVVGLVQGSGKPVVHPLERRDAVLLLARLGVAIDEAWPPGEGVRP